MTSELKLLIGFTILLIAILAFFFQINRIWKIRLVMKNFLSEIMRLNENLDNIISYIQGKEKLGHSADSHKKICKYCIFRQTFVNPDSPRVFYYQCKLDTRKISLKDSCKRFQKDLQNSQI